MSTSFEHPTPLGRDEQLAAIDALLDAVVNDADGDDPRARALLIGGDAGIGKTTLVDSLTERSRAKGLRCAIGHCLDLATGTPFGPVTEALRDIHHHVGADDGGPRTSWLVSEARSISPSLGALLEATEALADQTPLVLVIEDFHWADASVRDYALAAMRTCRVPLLIVLTFRADDITSGHPLRFPLVELTRSPRAVRLDLGGLAPHEVRELVRRHSAQVPDAAELASLVFRSGGNPLYLEELLAADEPGVPRRLHDLLLRHVVGLSPPAAQLARLASVGGSRIDLEILEEASPLGRVQFAAAVHEMLERNVVIRRGGRFTFRHALLRESVHDDLLPAEVIGLHAAYARALRDRVEAGSTERRWQYGASLALHAVGACDWALALEASVWAGVAGKQYGSPAAADHFERALGLWDRVPDAAPRTGLAKADLPRLAARVLANEGVHDRVHDLLRQAVDQLEPDGDPLAACRVLTAVGTAWLEVPGLLSRREALDQAVALAGTAPSRELAEALIASCFHGCRTGHYGESLRFATRALDVARAIGANDLVSAALWELAEPLWCLGRCGESLNVHRQAVREAKRADEPGAALEASGELAYYLWLHGSVDDAVQLARQVRETAERAGLPRFVAFGAEQELEILVQQGRFSEATALFERYCVPALFPSRRWWTRSFLCLARGDMTGALPADGESFADHSDTASMEHSARLVEIYEGLPDPERAVGAAEAMMEQVAQRDSPLEHALAAHHAYRALVLARRSSVSPSPELVEEAAASLRFARHRASADWTSTWYGVHLSMAEAFEVELSGQSPVPQLLRAVAVAAPFGRYASLRPRLELARSQLAHGERGPGKDLLAAVWHDAHTMGSRWIESRAVLAGRRFRVPLPVGVDGHGPPSPLDRLTPREREVLAHVARGATDRAIAEALFITEKTASAHVGSVLAKLGVGNRGAAADLARAAANASDG